MVIASPRTVPARRRVENTEDTEKNGGPHPEPFQRSISHETMAGAYFRTASCAPAIPSTSRTVVSPRSRAYHVLTLG